MRASDDVLNGACDDAVDRVDVGGAGTMQFYSGSPPATLGGAPAGDLLATATFAATAFGNAGTPAAGQAQGASMPRATTGATNGTIGFARVRDGSGTVLWDDDDVGTSGNNILVNTTTVSAGVDFELTSYLYSVAPSS